MHGHMGCVGDQAASTIKQGAREIEALFDVDGIGGIGKRRAHLFSNRHEEIVEHFEHDRVSICAHSRHALGCNKTLKNEIAMSINSALPARFNHVGAGWFNDDRRPFDGSTHR